MPETTGRKLRYVGPHKAVSVPALGEGVTVKRNHQVTVEDAAIATSLLEQRENWREVGGTKKDGGQGDEQDGDEGADDPAGEEGS